MEIKIPLYSPGVRVAAEYQSPGTVGHVLASVASGQGVDLCDLLGDIASTLRGDAGAAADMATLLDSIVPVVDGVEVGEFDFEECAR